MPQTRLFRTSSFRLAAIYLALFTVSVLILGAVVYAVVHTQIAAEIDQDIGDESAALLKEYSAHGRDRLQVLIPTRGGSFAYGLVGADGRLIAGELAAPAGAGGWTYLREPEGDEADAEGSVDVRALVTAPRRRRRAGCRRRMARRAWADPRAAVRLRLGARRDAGSRRDRGRPAQLAGAQADRGDAERGAGDRRRRLAPAHS